MPGLAYPFSVAVEGKVDEAVARRILAEVGALEPAPTIYVTQGKSNLRRKVAAYNRAASRFPWLVLVDLDTWLQCPSTMRQQWIPEASENMCFRIAVPQIESWLIADRAGIARYLQVSLDLVPTDIEHRQNAKDVLVSLATRSRNRAIREDMVYYVNGVATRPGKAYTTRMMEFAEKYWNVRAAAENSDSLRRCLVAVQALAQKWIA